ncbi:uncharacterized protein LOC134215195 [Armigeres subalbatus]|uniref:uncharacterized protein LOC134215195 n=1 Tax=Armigeres subalbatus TaxID=124917 RepID=UPI002ED0FDC6
MAVLYHLLKDATVPLLTVTDLQQKWGKIAAQTASDMYRAKRLKDLCFSERSGSAMQDSLNVSEVEEPFENSKPIKNTKYQQYMVSETEQSQILQQFVKSFPNSALGYELCGRPSVQDDINPETETNIDLQCIEVSTRKLSLNSSCSIISFEDFSMQTLKLFCTKADFIIYSEFEDKCFISTIDLEEEYVYELLNALKEVYFNIYLKYLYTLKN